MENGKITHNNLTKTKKTVLLAFFFALCIVLSYAESMIPPIPLFPPGAKLGLSNAVIMYSLFFIGRKETFTLAILKGIFVFLTRGATAGFLSLSGGLFSILIMCLILMAFKGESTYGFLSVMGAVFHNIGQFVAISIIFGSFALISYLPVLIIFGVFAGIATATVLKFIMPAFKNLFK
jgi:heptaprenyl diphosphate synthase